ncbi:MAG: acetyl-CoA carboxylase biotin carboxylase subunit [Candidatus Kapaibacteriales bacterium]
MGIATVAVYSDIDKTALHVKRADESIHIGGNQPSDSYLNIDKILEAAKSTGADALHPGYGFLSENSKLIQKCEDEGIIFIGPKVSAVEILGSKTTSRDAMKKAGVPIVPGIESIKDGFDEEALYSTVEKIGYPVMVKAADGGGGKGMRKVDNKDGLLEAISSAKRESQKAFGSDDVFIEKFVENPRHIEIQIACDKLGNAVHFFERECSIQRRHQKIIEEAPSPFLDQEKRMSMGKDAIKAVQSVEYDSVGTVEFLADDNGNYYFLEVNTRIQVEHPVSEMITGHDLIEEQIRIAQGEALSVKQSDLFINGHSIECRIYAEDGDHGFVPSVGKIVKLQIPEGKSIRFDAGIEENTIISPYYDPIMGKLIVKGDSRVEAIETMQKCLEDFTLFGVKTSIGFMHRVLGHPEFKKGNISTSFLQQYENDLELNPQIKAAAAAAIISDISKKDQNQSNEVEHNHVDHYDAWNSIKEFRMGRA